MGEDYGTLCNRFFASPLYRKIKSHPAVVAMLIQRIYDTWVNRPLPDKYAP